LATDTIPSKVLSNGEKHGAVPAYHTKQADGTWRQVSWRQYADEVRQAAKALIALGLEPGQPVAVLGFNRPEWVIFDVAAMAAGGAPAGIYTTSSPDEVAYVLNHSEAPVVLVENEHQWKKIEARRDALTHLRHVVAMKGAPIIEDKLVLSWDEFMAKAAEVDDAALEQRLEALEPGGLATLIYTSGTTGPPKAVMLSHDNLTWTAGQAIPAIGIGPTDRILSYLPLSHIAEQQFTIAAPALSGAQVFYAESIDKLADNLREVRPTIFFAVPRVWEKFQAGISERLAEAHGAKKAIAERAQQVGKKVNTARGIGEPVHRFESMQYGLFDRLVYSKIREAIGLGDSKFLVTAAAPISKELLEFFAGLGIIIYEVYGQSEDTGPTTISMPGKVKFGSVGPVYPGVEMRIAEDGEILVRGRNVFLGYYKDPEATNATLVDGWLHSGDLGEIDEEGFLWITGRKKDLIITAGGKNVAPKNIEGSLKNHVLVSEAVVVGDRRKYLTCLVTLDAEATARFQETQGTSGEPTADPALLAEIQAAIDQVNEGLARVEQLKKFTVLPRELSIEGGELTPTLKVKRNKVAENFSAEIEAMYTE
jgi:long-chain acyl-CoA synthetase